MKKLILYGEASKKIILEINVSDEDCDMSLMNFLLRNKIPVASSCIGEGICKKCTVTWQNHKIISCQKKMYEVFADNNEQTITFSYL